MNSVATVDQFQTTSHAPPGVRARPTVDGKFLSVGGQRFWIKGVTYGSFGPNEEGEPFPPLAQLRDDFAFMRESGINTVRIYSPPSDRIADAAAEAGLYLIPDICWGPRECHFDDPERVKYMLDWTSEHSRRLADHPAILMYSIGNEIPPLIVRWHGRKCVEDLLHRLYDVCKENAPETLVTYANHPPTEHLNLSFLDVVSYNVYLEREQDFRKYLARLQMLAGERPLFLAELGLDARHHGHARQSEYLDWQLRAVWEKGLCGATIYSWTDEWSIYSERIEGWEFGLTDFERRAKPALQTVRQIYESSHYELRRTPWPRVSVVVASYNGGRTLDQCLRSLTNLNYPDYEVIVVNDGSTDQTREIIARHDVKSIHVPNGGLSRARNLGIDSASGEIVAFIDSDAYADEEWLYYLVTALEEHDAAGVGGPNLSPPHDPFVAQCVDHAPGNPTHVLTDDELAEHIPGCNMAFRKDALIAMNGFDPIHRAAGDDVDVCWKLLAQAKKIAFSPCAIVWHHRRPTIKAFWRQQVGYGYAEAHLEHHYPGRFNVFGDVVWSGSIYDGVNTGLRREGLPSLFRPHVYQGLFGSAQFQSIYQPFLNWWFQIFTSAEWTALSACLLACGLLSLATGATISAGVTLCLSAVMFVVAICAAVVPAIHASRAKGWRGADLWRGRAIVTWLQLMQPLALAWGRIKGWYATRKLTRPYSAVERFLARYLNGRCGSTACKST